ncbi:Heparinase II/III-like protein [Opitutaceae bacterium TAV1]|nr:Heparinase II/III-like protein [Opitutaceae bacterium TAV1]
MTFLRVFLMSILLSISPLVGGAPVADTGRLAAPPAGQLLLSDAELAEIHRLEREDPLMRGLLDRVREAAEMNLTLPPNTHLQPGDRNMLGQSRAAAGRIIASAFAYRLDGDKRQLEAARRDLLNVCGFPDWNPVSFLDTAEMGFGVALGYAWLRPELSAEDRATIRAALVRNLLGLAPEAYQREGRGALRWQAFGSRDTTLNNWNFVCNAGFVAAALALRDEEPELAAQVLAGARASLPLAMGGFAPDGAWPEGPTYWSYGTTYLVNALAMLEETPEGDGGVADLPGFDRTLFYALQVFGPTGLSFNFADSNPAHDYSMPLSTYVWLARRFGHPEVLPEVRRLLQAKVRESSLDKRGMSGRGLVFCALFYPEKQASAPAAATTLPLDAHFRGEADFVVMRSRAADPDALWVGLKGGHNNVPHSHLDLGSFVLDAGGVRWAVDLGQDNYGLPRYFDRREGGQRWKYYRMNNRSHNTVMPGDRLQSATATAPIVRFESAPEEASATVDLTAAYPGAAKKMLRQVSLPGRAAVVIEDKIEGLRAGESLTWRMLTPARITLSEDGRTATLAQAGKTLRAVVSAPEGARFSASPARPPTREEKQNDGISVLAVTLVPDAPDLRLIVRFEPEPAARE